MKNCKHCNAIPREYWDQKSISYDGNPEGNTEEKIFHIVECSKGCHRVVSFKSITNARNLWKKQNTVIINDLYDAIREVTGFQFTNEKCEEIRMVIRDFEGKI